MPGLLIKHLPAELHKRLRESAVRHRRSMTQQALVLLEDGLARAEPPAELPPPLAGRTPLTRALADRGRRLGRK
jgi:plasmid stability protein